jgi:short-subunit dehydrogenase
MNKSRPVAIITGASSGIGEACARLFSKKGYRVVLAARRMKKLRALADEIQQNGGEALPVQADVTQQSQLQAMVEKTLAVFGQIDVLVNNAGMGKLVWFDQQSLDEIQTQLAVNVGGVLLASRLVLPHMMERRTGSIVNIASVAGFVPPPTYTVYGTTKFAIRGFTEGLRSEVKPFGIHVGAVYPGAVATEFDEKAGVSWETEKTTPNWLLLSAEEVAQQVFNVVERRAPQKVIPWIMNLSIWLNAHLPRLIRLAYAKLFQRGEEEDIVWGQPH